LREDEHAAAEREIERAGKRAMEFEKRVRESANASRRSSASSVLAVTTLCAVTACDYGLMMVAISADRPFHAIWTPMQSRMKAITRRIPWAVGGAEFSW